MDWEITPELVALRREGHEAGAAGVAPALSAREQDPLAVLFDDFERWDVEVFRELGRRGIIGAWAPQEFGGRGLSALQIIMLLEGLGEGCSDAGLMLAYCVHGLLVADCLASFGTQAQKQQYLPALATAGSIWGMSLRELEGATNNTDQVVMATQDGGEWLLSGRKPMVVNGPAATHFLVTAVTQPARTPHGATAFVVEAGAPGSSLVPSGLQYALRSCAATDLLFDNCRVPASNVIGSMHQAIPELMPRWLAVERTLVLAPWLGILEGLLQLSINQSKTAVVAGRPLSEFQALRRRLMDMKMCLTQGKNLLYHASAAFGASSVPGVREAAVAKLFMCNAMQMITQQALHVHALQGLQPDARVARAHRDAAVWSAFAGSTDLLQSVIAGSLLHMG